jgi:hypothetical protein
MPSPLSSTRTTTDVAGVELAVTDQLSIPVRLPAPPSPVAVVPKTQKPNSIGEQRQPRGAQNTAGFHTNYGIPLERSFAALQESRLLVA